jgi:phospholipid/cholesterol/gamma-HCH transport system substrate-binding protein
VASDYTKSEIVAGTFVLAGVAAIAYLSISIGGAHVLPAKTYHVTARFSNVGDLKLRAPVKIAGVTVGQVRSIHLADYYGEVDIAVDRKVVLPKDTIASISTSGLLGESFLSLSPGGADQDLTDGGRITQTEPALNVADLLARYAFGGQKGDEKGDHDGDQDDAKPGAAPGDPAVPPLRGRTPPTTKERHR